MKSLHNSENIGNIVEPKEGERKLLCSNTADIRSPSLGIDNSKQYLDEKIQLDYLAEMLFEFFSVKRHDTNQYKTGGSLLQGFDTRASRRRK